MKSAYKLTIFFFLLCLLVTSCAPIIKSKECPKEMPTMSLAPLGITVSPVDSVSIETYNESRSWTSMFRGIFVEIDPSIFAGIDTQSDETLILKTFTENVNLYINDHVLSNSNLRIDSGGGDYYLSWAPKLQTGLYTIDIVISDQGKEVLKYRWNLCITP